MRLISLLARKGLLTTLVLMLLCVYFVYHALHGSHGLQARVALKKKLSALQAEFFEMQVERKRLEHYISLMQSEKLDPDLLDEQARRQLNLSHTSDVIIMRKADVK